MKFVLLLLGLLGTAFSAQAETLHAGAATVDISPQKLPAIRNGGFLQALWKRVDDPLHARALVLKSGSETVVICVVDSCMLPTDVCNDIKTLVTQQTGIAKNRILISSTHTHSAPGTMAMCLGTRKDAAYTAQMIPQVAAAITNAHARLRPAKAGWGAVDAHDYTHCRRWIRRSDKVGADPFGETTIRAMMHPGYLNPDSLGPSGPTDPQLSLLSVVGLEDEKPICVMANYSMHYFGSGDGFSADYFGEVARALEKGLGGDVVGIVSQGTSGDQHWMDYSEAKREGYTRQQYSEALAAIGLAAWKDIRHRADVPLRMAETLLPLGRRLPSAQRLAWARPLNEKRGDAPPKNQPEVYAEQAEWIHENPKTELVLQAVQIGDLGIAAMPNEVYGITGLKIKAQSPLAATFNIELANGAEGYIPPPEQHRLGGYTTWPARTAGLEETAEPKIVEAVLGLLEKVSGKQRRPLADAASPYSQAIMKDSPVGYWRLNDLSGPQLREATGQSQGEWEHGVAYGLPGVQRVGGAISAEPEKPSPFSGPEINRAVHVAGSRFRVEKAEIGHRYSAEFWFWNALPYDLRPVTGYLFSRGQDGDKQALGEHLGIGGTSPDVSPGKLFFYTGNGIGKVIQGKTKLARLDWHHVVISRDEKKLVVYLDGQVEMEAEVDWTLPDGAKPWFLGGRCDQFAGFEGKMDEVAIYSAPLDATRVRAHFQAAERTAPMRLLKKPDSEPQSPQKSLQSLHLPTGFEASIVAAEPLVLDPVAFDWDAQGRLWVVEMADYPLGLDDKGAAGGRVRILTDSNADGTYDQSTLFAEGLNFPNGIITWRRGCIVTAAPDILYLEDTNGDGKSDKKEVLYTGLSEGNQQLRANGLRWGLDNWIYVAAGGHHGKHGADTRLLSKRTGVDTLIGSRDFRIRPDTGEIEAQSGPTQFGRNRDEWGHWFGTQNSHPLWHYVLPDHYLMRNPHLAAPEARVQLPGGSNPPVYPASSPEKRYHSFQQAGRYTSACGGMIYGDSWLFSSGQAHAFIAEPFHNLVQHLELKAEGITFSAQRPEAEGQPDFFASEDRWCRPVMIRTGPDGALWIADMYRYMIEHPHWLPKEGKEELLPHYRLGDDMGRIYRVTRQSAEKKVVLDLSQLDTKGLVHVLESSNAWLRDKAQQMLLWKGGAEAVPGLKNMAAQAKLPQSRLQALCVLDGLQALTAEELMMALKDQNPGVRENALRLAEKFPMEAMAEAVIQLVEDEDAKVKLQLAFSLGQWPQVKAGQALAQLFRAHEQDTMMVTACLSSALPHLTEMSRTATLTSLETLVQMALAVGNREALAELIKPALKVAGGAETWDWLGCFLDGLSRQKTKMAELQKKLPEDELASLLAQTDSVFQKATESLSSGKSDPAVQMAAAELLTRRELSRELAIGYLLSKLQAGKDAREWQKALKVLVNVGDARFTEVLQETWPSLLPSGREQALDALMSRNDWTGQLLAWMGEGKLSLREVDAGRRLRLLNHPNAELKQKAGKLFSVVGSPTRTKVVEQFRPALAMKMDPQRGKKVYQRTCAACHVFGKEGRSIGPDLRTVSDHPAEKILTNILDPNLDIQPGFHAYSCTLGSGEQIFGLIASESAASVTFKLPDGSSRAVLRKDIGSLKSLGVSLMPEGLEAALTPQDLADLIGYLKAGQH
ncbi:PVC-type heme-binding CxxCH protein [Prosthecobacter dejongeii]|uniref:Putative membrane-bound dehydrogenase-like protein n=1 Tax=Prosthecobacter dejongeii TaxID=48465 RepID=A0A7W8DRH9_9BACT|nr:PVC-type heme-binding CxxCH protein [Prosthecobacter dejongeii]MBB5038916.1 putative membrane-bound dehydrogenase-like protein [Prosthecobacter dejongeii]